MESIIEGRIQDDSGLMQGTIHRKVFEEHQGLIEIGAVLVVIDNMNSHNLVSAIHTAF